MSDPWYFDTDVPPIESGHTDFHDLPAEERAYWYDKARDETGQDFHDLSAEERGHYYDRAEGRMP